MERKHGWQVAEEAGEATPYGMQHLLDRAKWDCDGVRDELRAYLSETLGDEAAVLFQRIVNGHIKIRCRAGFPLAPGRASKAHFLL